MDIEKCIQITYLSGIFTHCTLPEKILKCPPSMNIKELFIGSF